MTAPWSRRGSLAIRVSLATVLTVSHAVTTSPYVYPHYVVLILAHPFVLSRFFGIRLGVPTVLWVSTTLFLHPMGGLYGWYATVWWFDHLTHFASATVVAALGYLLALSVEAVTCRPHRRLLVGAFAFGFVMAAGHLWEVIETYTPLLTVYGPNDTFWDYVFDALGGLVILVVGDRWLSPYAAEVATHLEGGRSEANTGSEAQV